MRQSGACLDKHGDNVQSVYQQTVWVCVVSVHITYTIHMLEIIQI